MEVMELVHNMKDIDRMEPIQDTAREFVYY